MLAITRQKRFNHNYTLCFNGSIPNDSPYISLPSEPKNRKLYLEKNKDVVLDGFADGNISLLNFFKRRFSSFFNMIAEDQKIEREANLLEKHLREVVKNNHDLNFDKTA